MLRRHLAAFGIGDEFAFGDTRRRIVRFVILARGEEWLVGGNQRNAARVSKIDQARFRDPLAPACRGAAVQCRGDCRTGAAAFRSATAPANSGRRRSRYRAGRPGHRRARSSLVLSPSSHSSLTCGRSVRRRVEEGARGEPHQAAVAASFAASRTSRGHVVPAAVVREHPGRRNRRRARSRQSAGCRISASFSENSSAPNILSVSVSAIAGWRSFLASSASRAIGHRAFQQGIGRVDMKMDEAGGSNGNHELKTPLTAVKQPRFGS